jgi:hypothetical protein
MAIRQSGFTAALLGFCRRSLVAAAHAIQAWDHDAMLAQSNLQVCVICTKGVDLVVEGSVEALQPQDINFPAPLLFVALPVAVVADVAETTWSVVRVGIAHFVGCVNNGSGQSIVNIPPLIQVARDRQIRLNALVGLINEPSPILGCPIIPSTLLIAALRS